MLTKISSREFSPRPPGTLEYSVVPGRFLEFCQKARDKDGVCVLIIDEINRTNLSASSEN